MLSSSMIGFSGPFRVPSINTRCVRFCPLPRVVGGVFWLNVGSFMVKAEPGARKLFNLAVPLDILPREVMSKL